MTLATLHSRKKLTAPKKTIIPGQMSISGSSSGRLHLGQLSLVRAVAALLVVCFHTHVVLILPKYFGTSVFPVFAAGTSGVQLFFVLSGFVIYTAHRGDAEYSLHAVVNFVWKRFLRLYPLLWMILLLILPVALSGMLEQRPDLYNIFASFLILPLPAEKLLAVEWTLRHEILFYTLFLVFLWRRRIGLVVLIGWGVVGSLMSMMFDAGWLIEFLFNSNHLLFILGMGVAWRYTRGQMPASLAALASGLATFSTAYALSLANLISADVGNLLYGLGASGIIYGLVAQQRWSRVSPAIEQAGGASYALYLIHFPLVSVFARLFVVISRHVPIPLELVFLLIVGAAQLGALIVHQYIERPILAFLRSRSADFLPAATR